MARRDRLIVFIIIAVVSVIAGPQIAGRLQQTLETLQKGTQATYDTKVP